MVRGQFEATVAGNQLMCREHFKLVLRLKGFPVTIPGQFVQISCRDEIETADELKEHLWELNGVPRLEASELRSPMAMLRRPFSLAGRRDFSDHVELDIIHRVVGMGTDWLSGLQIGQAVSVLGPLGNGFVLPPRDSTALLVGGGVGIPPMIYLAEKLKGQNAVAFAGAVTRDLLSLTINGPIDEQVRPVHHIGEFSRWGVPSVVSTDDGSCGFRGYITQALEAYLDESPFDPASTVIFTCGPELMMKRVAAIAADRGITCQIAVERAMACGMGTCQSCCIKVKKPDPAAPPMSGQSWAYRLACTDGPVFRAIDLLW